MISSVANANIEYEIIEREIIKVKVHNEESIFKMTPQMIKIYSYKLGEPENLGETLRAITYLESSFGKTGRVGDSGVARGITQIQIPTAKYILNNIMGFKNKFSDSDIKKLITNNDKISIILSKHYLVYLMKKFKDHDDAWAKGLLSYNTGVRTVLTKGLSHDPNRYLAKAKQFIIQERG
jgi:hypothetical protein